MTIETIEAFVEHAQNCAAVTIFYEEDHGTKKTTIASECYIVNESLYGTLSINDQTIRLRNGVYWNDGHGFGQEHPDKLVKELGMTAHRHLSLALPDLADIVKIDAYKDQYDCYYTFRATKKAYSSNGWIWQFEEIVEPYVVAPLASSNERYTRGKRPTN